MNGWSSNVAAWVFAWAETSARGLLASSLLPQADRVSAAAATNAAASTVFLRMDC